MTLEEEIARLDPKLSENALCVRFAKTQEAEIRKLAEANNTSAAAIVRTLVERGLREKR